ncbi:hypothetical protein Pcinc_032289 [Petrolisthes cinctipes]|uniref:Uncharacterized protein n=1 Tax=Petrolisthes cinctipes TaxID=88211 RepID=A0AAE1K3L3_PETCI|nr:hypothetical protein Pcinc_032289 [Petrolisthes cinctipes]
MSRRSGNVGISTSTLLPLPHPLPHLTSMSLPLTPPHLYVSLPHSPRLSPSPSTSPHVSLTLHLTSTSLSLTILPRRSSSPYLTSPPLTFTSFSPKSTSLTHLTLPPRLSHSPHPTSHTSPFPIVLHHFLLS